MMAEYEEYLDKSFADVDTVEEVYKWLDGPFTSFL